MLGDIEGKGVIQIGAFTWPLIGVVLIICALATLATMQAIREVDRRENPEVDEISGKVAKHPFALNPIVFIYIIVGLCMVVVIFYYWASSRN